MAKVYLEKARQVTADQFLAGTTPWPPGVDDCERMAGIPHYHYPNDNIQALNEGDWLLTEHRSGVKSIMGDAEFHATFNVPGP